MIPHLECPNLAIQITAPDGDLLSPADALDRAEALRHELHGLGLTLTVAPAMPPALADKPLTAALGGVEVAVLPPMLPGLVDFLRGWGQRNAAVRVRLAVLGGGQDSSSVDPAELTDQALADLVRRLWARLQFEESPSAPAASRAGSVNRMRAA